MELFTKSSTVRLRSHLDKHLTASSDHLTVCQSRHRTRHALWRVEPVPGQPALIRLKNLQTQNYLTASASPFLLGVTGKRVIQSPNPHASSSHWEPVRDGFQVKLRSAEGTLLRGNGGTAPWRGSVTHDGGSIRGGRGWVLWDVESVEVGEEDEVREYLSSLSSFASSVFDEDEDDDDDRSEEVASPMSAVVSYDFPSLSFPRSGMDLFRHAAAVRLRSHHDKYLTADDDEESVTQDRSGSSRNARWSVEFVPAVDNVIRLRSRFNKYLTASNQPFLLGMTGHKALQTLPKRLDSSVEWEPVREGSHVKLKTRYGNFLRANGGLPPWRNSVTHDIPQRSATQEWVLWEVEVLEILTHSPTEPHPPPLKAAISDPPPQSPMSTRSESSASSGSHSNEVSEPRGRSEAKMAEGRTVYYHVASDEYENGGDESGGFAMVFGGSSVEELTRRLEEETGLDDVVVCARSPLNKKLYPLRLQLPPNITMHVVVVPRDSEVARELAQVLIL
uniref:DUF569 domain-containing protein n=1 Tax=Kalanchoe fedtschenkoi TaxID=63787 RepID=A0A7N0V7L9_KALFE